MEQNRSVDSQPSDEPGSVLRVNGLPQTANEHTVAAMFPGTMTFLARFIFETSACCTESMNDILNI